ncbi:hypothetical protein ACFE04_023491 [Oxalis oulophora]
MASINGGQSSQQQNGFTMKLKRPHFCKVILGNKTPLGKLEIPKSFIKKYGNMLENEVILKVLPNKKWKIGLTKSEDGSVFLHKGWKHFLHYYSLRHGYFLVFQERGNSRFRVSLFDDTYSEIRYPYNPNPSKKVAQEKGGVEIFIIHDEGDGDDDGDDDDDDYDGDGDDDDDDEPCYKRKPMKSPLTCHARPRKLARTDSTSEILSSPEFRHLEPKGKDEDGVVCANQLPLIQHSSNCDGADDEVVISGDNACEKDMTFVHKHPAATPSTLLSEIKKVDLEKWKIKPITETADIHSIEPAKSFMKKITFQKMKYAMWLPMDFARETGLASKTQVTLKDSSEDGNREEWLMKLRAYGDWGRVRIESGWTNFFNAKGLSMGDSCLFEFVGGILHVKISRKGEKAR